MKIDKNFIGLLKPIIKKIPGVETLLSCRRRIIYKTNRVRELSGLIKNNRYVIFSLDSMMNNDVPLIRKKIITEVKEWLDFYGIMHLRKSTITSSQAQACAVLVFKPQALLKIPFSFEEYFKDLRHQTRHLIRKAEELGYEFREFDWNEHLEEIYEINTSKEIRQGEPMRGWYKEPVQPRYHTKEELKYLKNYGVFYEGKLRGYLHLLICEDFSMSKHIIGHADYLKDGIMNALVSYTVRECIRNSQIRWIYYGRYDGGSSLDLFKKHAGFHKYAILLDLDKNHELLRYSKRVLQTWRRI